VKNCAAADLVIGPYAAPVGFDDGSRNSQSHSQALGLCRKKRLKDNFGFIDRNAGAGIRYGEFGEAFDARRMDGNLAFGMRHGGHRVQRIANEIDDSLLNLNAIALESQLAGNNLATYIDFPQTCEA